MIDGMQVIGGGKMGSALVAGMVVSGAVVPSDVTIVEMSDHRRAELARELPGVRLTDTPIAGADALIAVKPDHVESVCGVLGGRGVSRILSIAAGVTVARLEAAVGEGVAVIRAMPNTPALVGKGMSAIASGSHATDEDLEWAGDVLGSVGEVVIVEEADLDAVTGVSGSGPAYVFLFAEALMSAAEVNGLAPETARLLVEQTLLGASSLLCESTDTAATLRQNVTSPNGTTAAGLSVFEEGDLRELVERVVTAATERARELGASS